MSRATGVPARMIDRATVVSGHEAVRAEPGAFYYAKAGERPDATLVFSCPCGCKAVMAIALDPAAAGQRGQHHYVNSGTREAPTLEPPIAMTLRRPGQAAGDVHWQGRLRNGVWESC